MKSGQTALIEKIYELCGIIEPHFVSEPAMPQISEVESISN
jgi:hypothetical protein